MTGNHRQHYMDLHDDTERDSGGCLAPLLLCGWIFYGSIFIGAYVWGAWGAAAGALVGTAGALGVLLWLSNRND
jgi:hypothetical protein